MYVCLHRSDSADSTIRKFNTLEELQDHLLRHTGPVMSLCDIEDDEQIDSAQNEDQADEDCIVFKASDLIVETQHVTVREPVALS